MACETTKQLRTRLELATFGFEVQRAIHCATVATWNSYSHMIHAHYSNYGVMLCDSQIPKILISRIYI